MVSNCFYLHFISQIITVGKIIFTCFLASLVTQLVKNGPEMPATWVQSLGWEDPLEEGMATHSSILAWRIAWSTVHGVANSWTVTFTSLAFRISYLRLTVHCCCCSVTKSCLTLCNPTNCSTPGFPVLHYLLKFAQTHVH